MCISKGESYIITTPSSRSWLSYRFVRLPLSPPPPRSTRGPAPAFAASPPPSSPAGSTAAPRRRALQHADCPLGDALGPKALDWRAAPGLRDFLKPVEVVSHPTVLELRRDLEEAARVQKEQRERAEGAKGDGPGETHS